MVNLERLIRKHEERDGNYLIVYQATGGEYNSNPCVRVRFMYNSSPSIWVRVGDQPKEIIRDIDESEFLRVKNHARTLEDVKDKGELMDLEDYSNDIIEELLERRKYQELRGLIEGGFEDNETYVVVGTTLMDDNSKKKVKKLLSKFRRKMNGLCAIRLGGAYLT